MRNESGQHAGTEAGRQFKLQGDACVLRFRVRFLGLFHVSGTLRGGGGRVQLADASDQGAVHTWMPSASIRTGLTIRDRHLRGRYYFDAAKHPNIAYAGSATRIHGDNWLIDGVATAGNVRFPLVLNAEPIEGHSVGTDRGVTEYIARGSFDRRALRHRGTALLWRWLMLDDLVLGREVQVEIEVQMQTQIG